MAFCRNIPSNEKNAEPGDKKSRENKSRSPGFLDFRDFLHGIFRDFQILIPNPGFSGFSTRAFYKLFNSRSRSADFHDSQDFSLGIFSRFSNPDPDSRYFRTFGIFRSCLKSKIPNQNPGSQEIPSRSQL